MHKIASVLKGKLLCVCVCCYQMRFYEVVTPLRGQLTDLQLRTGGLTEELDTHRNQSKTLMEVLCVCVCVCVWWVCVCERTS